MRSSITTAKVTAKGQITIPRAVRKELKLEKGDTVQFLRQGDRVTMTKRENRIEAAFGLCRARRSASLQEMEEAIQQGALE